MATMINYVQMPKGVFQHECILDTFAFYLETTQIIKSSRRDNEDCWPRGALMLATAAVSLICVVYLHCS